LRIYQLSRDFKSDLDTHHWAGVIERINSGDMPPEDEPQPTQEEIAAFVTKLALCSRKAGRRVWQLDRPWHITASAGKSIRTRSMICSAFDTIPRNPAL